ncbi:MAG: aminopeptidase P family N-terminal domain-containing protein, partial [Butyrivibrio sp.]|nr:aminopeptidase P family N-terminal domain-containing protein [Butyrivibrio sp.]
MDNQVIQHRLSLLREQMLKDNIDYYMIPTADFHSSEYVSDYFKVREHFCGFSGSNGTLLVWQEGAGLWTDGRYFIQAQQELEGTGVELFRMMEEGVPTIAEFLTERLQTGQTLGFDGRVISASAGKRYEECFEKAGKEINIMYRKDLAEGIWTERPAFPAGRVTVLAAELVGCSVADKLKAVREKLREAGAEELLLTKLDDLMWLFNIRGCDVECNPVAMSYGYITQNTAVIFMQEQAVDAEMRAYLAANSVELRDYREIESYLEELDAGRRILMDMRYCSYAFYRQLAFSHIVCDAPNPTESLKAVKNPVELANMREIYLKDSVALTRFIYWLKSNIGKVRLTEVDAADKLEEFRREIPEFLGLSFPTIAGYGSNAAMMHYEAALEH